VTVADEETLRRVADAVAGVHGLDVLLLFGSRARGESHEQSDWDFGYLAADAFDPDTLLRVLALTLGTDHVDLADLRRAGGLLRYRAARDGVVVLERVAGMADAFRLEAADFWCDAGPLLERDYDAILASLEP
jgi:predicted nucleotidyltransferase